MLGKQGIYQKKQRLVFLTVEELNNDKGTATMQCLFMGHGTISHLNLSIRIAPPTIFSRLPHPLYAL